MSLHLDRATLGPDTLNLARYFADGGLLGLLGCSRLLIAGLLRLYHVVYRIVISTSGEGECHQSGTRYILIQFHIVL